MESESSSQLNDTTNENSIVIEENEVQNLMPEP